MYWSAAMCINGFYLVVLEYEREREVRETEREILCWPQLLVSTKTWIIIFLLWKVCRALCAVICIQTNDDLTEDWLTKESLPPILSCHCVRPFVLKPWKDQDVKPLRSPALSRKYSRDFQFSEYFPCMAECVI